MSRNSPRPPVTGEHPVAHLDSLTPYSSQKPTDRALNNAFRIYILIALISRIQFFYDIWCQYGAHLRDRFARNTDLSWPAFTEVIGAVGVWHIFGHIHECMGRFSSLYARHTGIADGEILETLWAMLNKILESC